MNKERFAQVEYTGAEFMVIGDWEEGVPEGEYEPGSKAGFYDYRIEFGTDQDGNDLDVTELLSQEAVNKIVTKAEEKLTEEI